MCRLPSRRNTRSAVYWDTLGEGPWTKALGGNPSKIPANARAPVVLTTCRPLRTVPVVTLNLVLS